MYVNCQSTKPGGLHPERSRGTATKLDDRGCPSTTLGVTMGKDKASEKATDKAGGKAEKRYFFSLKGS